MSEKDLLNEIDEDWRDCLWHWPGGCGADFFVDTTTPTWGLLVLSPAVYLASPLAGGHLSNNRNFAPLFFLHLIFICIVSQKDFFVFAQAVLKYLRFQVSGFWTFSWKWWTMSKQEGWCAVNSRERVWPINHLLPYHTIFLSETCCTLRSSAKGWEL